MKKLQWFVAYTHSRSEKKVNADLQDLNIESFLPLHLVKRQWSDRVKWVESPLFSSYVFVRTTEDMLYNLKSIYGVARFLSFENRFATVRDIEIEWIKKIISYGKEVTVHQGSFKKGEQVRVSGGPFEGVEGVLLDEHNKHRFILEISGIAQSISISIPIDYLQPLQKREGLRG